MGQQDKTSLLKEDGKYLAGKLLLAMPSMSDLRFNRAVIFICAHDANGAMGLMINHPLPGIEFPELLTQLEIGPEDGAPLSVLDVPVLHGGPVEGARGFLLHGPEFRQPDTVDVTGDFSVTGTLDAIREVARGNGPKKLLFVLGYAGWSAGQLDQEIQQNAWLIADSHPDIVFNPDIEAKWDLAFKKLGVDPLMLSAAGGRA